MKKTIMAAAMASAVALAACADNNSKSNTSICKESATCTATCDTNHKPHHRSHHDNDFEAVYSGILPAADADGIRYTLTVDYDDDSNFTKGDYELVEEYLTATGSADNSYRSTKKVKSEGDFTIMSKTVNGKTVKHMRLQPDADDSDADAGIEPMYFRIDSESSVTLVNSDLTLSDNPGLNYTLTIIK